MSMVEKERRRLSIGAGSSKLPGGKKPDMAKCELELNEAIAALKKEFKTVVAICSKTDKELARRASFSDKDCEFEGSLAGKEDAADFLRKKGVSYDCVKGNKPDAPNQDSYTLLYVDKEWALYGVFDGHGPQGHYVSDLARDKLVALFINHPRRESDPGAAFTDCFTLTQDFLESDEVTTDTSASGTTCTMVYHDLKRQVLTIAHVGDSRSIVGWRSNKPGDFVEVEDLTIDHKPDLPEEKARIEKANGRVLFDGFFNHRVFAKDGMYPGLNMSRALGDTMAHRKAGLSAKPDVKIVDLKGKKYKGGSLLVCSDGVWEFISSKDAIQLIAGRPNVQDAAKHLVKESYDLWMEDSNKEIADDITCILIEVATGAACA